MSMSARSRFNLASELGLARPAAIGAILVAAVALQSSLLTKVTLLGVIPQLLFVVVVSLAFIEGESVGIVVAFFGGLVQDLLAPESIVGLTALIYVVAAYSVGIIRYLLPSASVWTPVMVVAAVSALAEFSYAALSILLGQNWVSLAYTAKIAGLVVLYNTLLTPFVYPVVKNIADRVRPERVVRI